MRLALYLCSKKGPPGHLWRGKSFSLQNGNVAVVGSKTIFKSFTNFGNTNIRGYNSTSVLQLQNYLKTLTISQRGIMGTSTEPQGIHENVSALQMRTRLQRRKRPSMEEEDSKKLGYWNVAAYTTAEEYDLEKLTKGLLLQNLYVPNPLLRSLADPNGVVPDVVHVEARYQVGVEPREIYFFREGTTVFWNVPELESSNVLSFIRQFEQNSYDERLVHDESEAMPYTHSTGKSHLQDGHIALGSDGRTELDKYTFSNAIALSVKLGVWEASLNRYVDSIEFVTEDLKRGTKISMSREDVLRKTGELFALRHLINLSSDLLDTPDFYWDHEEQEELYQKMCSYFSINRRTRVMNEKLNHCVELVELLSSHLSDRHHIRLEWMIIILIMVEVGFEIIHYAGRYM
ncbi:required for meiotic nuclear division protein 1 homolog isoform X2 [Zootermopsis nevadensis]|uniref:Required for meiotic nuclear division protein 1-like protein n=1 Tax=Zootermopsis nevadensis TaxID=136037 RepID=A0A067RMT9_ZOONE|nr:required for meiotic nuclear division protein 1 homolog isoform X2 [Zootermopsis nevadensis]KDR21035.1 Required for meiotic nuclear division protein 1-like protein [Zootermopsis nevadensis]